MNWRNAFSTDSPPVVPATLGYRRSVRSGILLVVAVLHNGCISSSTSGDKDRSCTHLFGRYTDVAERTDDTNAEPGTRHAIRHVFGWSSGGLPISPRDRADSFVLEAPENGEIHLRYISRSVVPHVFSSTQWSCHAGTLRLTIKQTIPELHGALNRKEWRTVELKAENGRLIARFSAKSVGLLGIVPVAQTESKSYRFIDPKQAEDGQ